MFVKKLLVTAVVPLALLASACGSSDSGSNGSGATSSAPSAAPTGGQSIDSATLKKMQKCLTAAGISVGARPSGAPPSGIPSGGNPSGRPSGIPSGAPPGGGGAAFNNPQIQQALKACGLDVPSASPSNGGQ
jgi:hypothetical protein